MNYEGRIFRPPNEADAILLQVTVGCSHNGCRFCGMYREKRYRIKSLEAIRDALAFARVEYPKTGRVFLCDGDALSIPQATLVTILEDIQRLCPWVISISSYASAKSIALKSDHQLAELRALNLKLLHVGLESGDDATLKFMEKYGDARFHIEQIERVHRANMKSFVTVLLGLAGKSRSQIHAQQTAHALSSMKPNHVGALSLMSIPGTPLHSDIATGRFDLPSQREILLELRTLLEQTEMRGMFYANHASNYLPIRARLPRDRAEALEQVGAALAGRVSLKPEWLRGV